MIHDVDESLRTLVRRDVLEGTGVEVSLDAPTKDWAARRNAPVVNLYLYDIREDLERRTLQREDVRRVVDGREVIVERRMPARMMKLSYMITAWTQRPEDEHRLLSAVLAVLLRSDSLPLDVLQGSLAELRTESGAQAPVRMTIALPPPKDRSISDIWSALGGELKPSLDLVVTAPFDPQRVIDAGTPVLEGVVIDVRDTVEGANERRQGRNGSAPST